MITFFFKTYGCQANVADSEEVSKYLISLGCLRVSVEEQADVVIINTCAIRDKAEQKLFSYVGRLADCKREKPYVKIGVIGCVASYKKQEIYERFDHVSFVYGARDDIDTFCAYLTDLVVKLETTKQVFAGNTQTQSSQVQSNARVSGQDRDIQSIVTRKKLVKKTYGINPARAFVLKQDKPEEPELRRSFINIMTGCNKYCTYCIVPFTRGREISFSSDEIIEKVTRDVALGAKEITLVGQNVNSYKDPVQGQNFAQLLKRVAKLDGNFWVRWISPHPQDMTVELFDVIAEHKDRIVPYVHFPVQSGSNKILELMNRNYTRERYLEQINWLRDRIAHVTISTDIIVGFPGETKEDYQQTRELMELVRFDFVYSFIYSPRKYTRALKLLEQDVCMQEEKTMRLQALQKRQKEISLERNSLLIGKRLKSLVEKRLTNGKLLARTEGNVRVLFSGKDDLIGKFVMVDIDSTCPVNLSGTFVSLCDHDKIICDQERACFF